MKPLVSALEKYKKDNNSYPESLNLLTPHYIEEIPTTRVLTIKNVEYRRFDETYNLLFLHYLNGWDADIVFYNPEKKYDEGDINLKKFGDWRYYLKD